jgi:hypothetical protein
VAHVLLLDLTVVLTPKMYLRSTAESDFELWPSGELICSESFFSKVVSVEVDHYYDPMTIMYCPDLMVLIYFGTSGL